MESLQKQTLAEAAAHYHAYPRRGKIEVLPTKSCFSQADLTLAYTPGVAEPCREIQKDPTKASRYTARGNLVAVISNGTAVLGLGDIGPLAGKPVMEGKGLLFKAFADVDVFDIELNARTPDEVVAAVKALEPTFGAVNLEDIKAPDCFEIEERLKKEMNIPVFHDDQHGTAVITGAALLNAVELTGRDIAKVKVVVSGAGAAAIACTKFYLSLGIRPENVYMFDSKGLIHKGRSDLHSSKLQFARDEVCTMAEALTGADLFLGLSRKGLLTKELISLMAPSPIVFACANPDPEITYEDAKAARPDCIMGSGRSDWPNQINNVSCFPFLFRAALDVRATQITESMKIAAAKALAALAKEPVPASVAEAYGEKGFTFGPDYVIPKPLDPRILAWESAAVAQAAAECGVAQEPIADLEAYKQSLQERMAKTEKRIRAVIDSYNEEA